MNLWLTGGTVLVPVSRIEVHCIPYILEFGLTALLPPLYKGNKNKVDEYEEGEARKLSIYGTPIKGARRSGEAKEGEAP